MEKINKDKTQTNTSFFFCSTVMAKEKWTNKNFKLRSNLGVLRCIQLPETLDTIDLSEASVRMGDDCQYASLLPPCNTLILPPLGPLNFDKFLRSLPYSTAKQVKFLNLRRCLTQLNSSSTILSHFSNLEGFISPSNGFTSFDDWKVFFTNLNSNHPSIKLFDVGSLRNWYGSFSTSPILASEIMDFWEEKQGKCDILIFLSNEDEKKHYSDKRLKFSTDTSSSGGNKILRNPKRRGKAQTEGAREQKEKVTLDDVRIQREYWGDALGILKGFAGYFRSKIKVAVLDSGLQGDHPMAEKVVFWESVVPDQFAAEDSNGHGTAVASLIADELVGISPNQVELFVIKVLGDDPDSVEDAWVARGIEIATAQKVDIISLSVGLTTCTDELLRTTSLALAQGIIFVSCASNEGRKTMRNILYPSRLGGLLCIGGHDAYGKPIPLSSCGRELDFLALGEKLWVAETSGGYGLDEGTSLSTPQVTALCALLLCFDRGRHGRQRIRNTNDMRSVLLQMAAKPGHHDEAYGFGALSPSVVFREEENVETTKTVFYRCFED